MTLGAAQGVAATGTHSGTFGGSAANDPRAQNTYGIAGGEGRPGPTGGGTYIPGGSTTTKNINWNEILKAGASPDYFGHADYSEALSRGIDRGTIRGYLDQNPHVLRGSNPEGMGGLYDQIKRTGADAIGAHFGDHTLEGRNKFFGTADYAASRAGGASDLQIKDWLANNPGTLRGGNTYESLKTGYNAGALPTNIKGGEIPYTTQTVDWDAVQGGLESASKTLFGGFEESLKSHRDETAKMQKEYEDRRKQVTVNTPQAVKQGALKIDANRYANQSALQTAASLSRPKRSGKLVKGINI